MCLTLGAVKAFTGRSRESNPIEVSLTLRDMSGIIRGPIAQVSHLISSQHGITRSQQLGRRTRPFGVVQGGT
jgi:hypothetical protein